MSKTTTPFVTFPLPRLSRNAFFAASCLFVGCASPGLGQNSVAPTAPRRAYQTTPVQSSTSAPVALRAVSPAKASAPTAVAKPGPAVRPTLARTNTVRSAAASSTAAGTTPTNLVRSAGSNTKLGSQAAQDKAKEINREAIALQSEGKLSEACALYRQAIALNGAGAGYHNNLALVLKDLDLTREAEAEERVALRLRPKRADYHVNLGIILQRQKRNTEAEASFKEALSMDASDSDCHYRLGQTYLDMGDLERAVEEGKLAVMLKPDNSDYRELMGDILAKSERWDDSMNEYRRVIELRSYTPATISGVFQAKIDAAKSHVNQK